MQKRAVFYVYVIFWGQVRVENGAIVVRFSSPEAASGQSPADVPVAERQPSSSSDSSGRQTSCLSVLLLSTLAAAGCCVSIFVNCVTQRQRRRRRYSKRRCRKVFAAVNASLCMSRQATLHAAFNTRLTAQVHGPHANSTPVVQSPACYPRFATATCPNIERMVPELIPVLGSQPQVT